MFAHTKRSLRAAPDGDLSIGVVLRGCILRFDVSLVHHGCKELALDNYRSILKTFLDIANLFLIMCRDIAGNITFLPQLIGAHVVEQNRGISLHGFSHIQHRRQHFVLDLNQRRGFLSDMRINRRHGRDGMTEIQNLIPCQNVIALMTQVNRALAEFCNFTCHVGQILCGDYRPHARIRFSFARING